ncbi:MAG: hypothetical protein KVP17_000195 [Porospora cf. gigantea B]|uniref:uncharacterized protein n=2 Tax=Porospora cf. gigantea B TaxID=2853592 RepID=UPI003571A16B|nr:MAG: hypothetical protein KVP17_000195 [Porospora cf. gigantea B]
MSSQGQSTIWLAVLLPFLILICVFACYCGLAAALVSDEEERSREREAAPTVVVHLDEEAQSNPMKTSAAKDYYSSALDEERDKTSTLEARVEWLQKANAMQEKNRPPIQDNSQGISGAFDVEK